MTLNSITYTSLSQDKMTKVTEGMECVKTHILGWEVLDYQYEDLPWSEFYPKMDEVRKCLDVADYLSGKKVKLDKRATKKIIQFMNEILDDFDYPEETDKKIIKEMKEIKDEKQKLLKAIGLKKYDYARR